MRAAETLADAAVVLGNFREVGRVNPRHIALELSTDITMIFRANHHKVPLLEGGQVDRGKVTRVQVLSVEKHGS